MLNVVKINLHSELKMLRMMGKNKQIKLKGNMCINKDSLSEDWFCGVLQKKKIALS